MKTLILLILTISPRIGFSCYCNGGMEMKEFNIVDFLKYDEILFGVIEKKDKCHSQNVKIINSIKKGLHGDILIYNESSTDCNTDCDTEYSIGDTVLFYINNEKNKWINLYCSKTVSLKSLSDRYYEYNLSQIDLYNYSIRSLKYLNENSNKYEQEMTYPNGNLIYKGNILNGLFTGEWVFYKQNGKIKRKGNYKNGKKTGQWDYFTDGTIHEYVKVSGYWDDDNKTGTWLYYNRDGKIIKEEIYSNNELIKEIRK